MNRPAPIVDEQAASGRPPNPLIRNVQLLRAFAALSVVFLHTTDELRLPAFLQFGFFGVDIFFAISGFIICYITSIDPGQFFAKRVIRIVPFYWTATILLFALAHAAPSLVHSAQGADLRTLLTSLFFIPYQRGDQMQPLLLPGWTLNLEMYFYVIFWGALSLSRKFAPLIAAAFIATIYAALNIWTPYRVLMTYYGNSVALEFIWGMGVFYLYKSLPRLLPPARRGDTPFVIFCGAGALALVALPYLELHTTFGRAIFLGLPAAAVVLCALMLEARYRIVSRSAFALLLGEASYALYLLHPYVVFGLNRTFMRAFANSPFPITALLVVVYMVAASAIAIAVFLYFERPVMAFLRRRFLHRGPAIASVAVEQPG